MVCDIHTIDIVADIVGDFFGDDVEVGVDYKERAIQFKSGEYWGYTKYQYPAQAIGALIRCSGIGIDFKPVWKAYRKFEKQYQKKIMDDYLRTRKEF